MKSRINTGLRERTSGDEKDNSEAASGEIQKGRGERTKRL